MPRRGRHRLGLEEVGPHRRQDQAEEGTQDPVVVQARDVVEPGPDLLDQRGGQLVAGRTSGRSGSNRASNSRTSSRAIADVADRQLLDVVLAERRPGLPQVLRVGPQDDDLPPGQPGPQHQPVEAVALGLPAPGRREGLAELVARARSAALRRSPGSAARSRRCRRPDRRHAPTRRAARRPPRRPRWDRYGSTAVSDSGASRYSLNRRSSGAAPTGS